MMTINLPMRIVNPDGSHTDHGDAAVGCMVCGWSHVLVGDEQPIELYIDHWCMPVERGRTPDDLIRDLGEAGVDLTDVSLGPGGARGPQRR